MATSTFASGLNDVAVRDVPAMDMQVCSWYVPMSRGGKEDAMKLYWSPQTRAFRAVWMLEEAGVPYERVPIDIRNNGQADPEFRRVNPMTKVPALKDGEAMVAESAAICAYIAERCPQAGLAPAVGDPARGRYLHWLFFAAGCIEPAYTRR